MTPQTLTLEEINDLYALQFEKLPEVKDAYGSLLSTERRWLDCGDLKVGLQCNPARIKSTGADVSKSGIGMRPCFLCASNRPDRQISFPIIEGWDWLVNPYPIFPVHFTIVGKDHSPQSEMPFEMIEAADKAPELAFFFNGARAGASAPDHLHFQGVLREELPLLSVVEERHDNACSGTADSSALGDFPFAFRSYVIRPDMEGMRLIASLPKLSGLDAGTGIADKRLVNIIVWKDDSGILRALYIPRKAHRPSAYFRNGDEQIIVSPGSVDMAGMLILPRKEDFDKISQSDIRAIYSETGLTAAEMASLPRE